VAQAEDSLGNVSALPLRLRRKGNDLGRKTANRLHRRDAVQQALGPSSLTRYDALPWALGEAMRRRDFIKVVTGSAAVWPLNVRAQQFDERKRTIGFLAIDSEAGSAKYLDALRAGLHELGYLEGKNIAFEFRYADGKYERLAQLAAELLDYKIDVLVTYSTPGGLAAKNATSTVPIVDSSSGDPVAAGLVASLSRPGGNLTGVAFFQPELVAKRLELLKQILPGIRAVAVLFNSNNPISILTVASSKTAARALNIELKEFGVHSPAEFEDTFIAMASSHVEAVAVLDDPILIVNGETIGQLASKQRLPSIGFNEIAEGGGLVSYSVDFASMFRQSARLIDKILRGEQPRDIPVEQVTTFDLVINLKTAKELAVDISPTMLVRATKVIE
jgi:putative tryptophan/tyrosine transport system substrate-binding protein